MTTVYDTLKCLTNGKTESKVFQAKQDNATTREIAQTFCWKLSRESNGVYQPNTETQNIEIIKKCHQFCDCSKAQPENEGASKAETSTDNPSICTSCKQIKTKPYAPAQLLFVVDAQPSGKDEQAIKQIRCLLQCYITIKYAQDAKFILARILSARIRWDEQPKLACEGNLHNYQIHNNFPMKTRQRFNLIDFFPQQLELEEEDEEDTKEIDEEDFKRALQIK